MKPVSHLFVDFELSYDPIQENAALLRHMFTGFYNLSIKTDAGFVKQNDISLDDINKEFIKKDTVLMVEEITILYLHSKNIAKKPTQLCYNT